MPTKRSAVKPPKKVAQRLKTLLEYWGISQTQLAKSIGVTPASVSQWMSATVRLSDINGQKIAELLGEDVEFVMGRSDRGTRGYGAVLGALEDALGGELMSKLGPVLAENPGRIRELVSQLIDEMSKKSDDLTDDPEKD